MFNNVGNFYCPKQKSIISEVGLFFVDIKWILHFQAGLDISIYSLSIHNYYFYKVYFSFFDIKIKCFMTKCTGNKTREMRKKCLLTCTRQS